ncbi:MAG: DUF3883 domain-containing protein [Minisyncoccales bacterium]
MLKELSNYENLGTPKYFWELACLLAGKGKKWTEKDIQGYFFNRIVEGRSIFDGCIPFCKAIGIIEIDEAGTVTLNSLFVDFLINERYFYNKLLEKIFLELTKDDVFHEIFCSKNVSYDIIYHSIQISNSAFLFKYANFKHLLISFNFIYPHPDSKVRSFIINSKFKRVFDKHLLPEIKKRRIGINELSKILEQKKMLGEQAEDYVIEFEKIRLHSHVNLHKVQRISDYDTSAGYDIVSYEDIDSTDFDRFIEVKSYSKIIGFHWSRNEIDIARIKKEAYYLYLVDRNKINENDYTPMVIKNPYKEILSDPKWNKRTEEFLITLQDN